MRGRKIVSVRKLLDLLRCQLSKNITREIAQQRVAQTIDSFEMFEEQNQALEMRCIQFAIDAVERMSNRMRDHFALQKLLQIENVFPQDQNLSVLRLGNSPNEQIYFAGISRKISRNLLAHESTSKIAKLEAAIDRVVIGNREEMHPRLLRTSIKLFGSGVAIRKIESTEKPVLRPIAVLRMQMKIATAHTVSNFGLRISDLRPSHSR